LAAGLLVERDAGGTVDRFRGRLMFPINNPQGRGTGFGARATDSSFPKYLNSPQTAIFDKSGLLYALDRARTAIRTQDLAVIVEGYMDALMAHQHGFTQVVATMGTALTSRQVGLLKRLTRNISLAFDADTAGETASQRAAATTAEAMEGDTGSFNIPVGALIGKVDKIEEKHGEKNGKVWTRWDATINGKRYGIFAPQIRDSLEVGATYALTVKDSGEYSNIVDVHPTLMDEKSVRGWNGLVGHENTLGGEISVLVLPQGKDPDEIIHEDTAQWQNLVSEARPMVDYLYDVVTAKLDISKPQDKIQAISELYPLTAAMKDPVRRDHYRQRLARMLGVDERTLADQAARLTPHRREKTVPVPPTLTRTAHSPLEEYCMALLVQHPELDFLDKGLVAEYFESTENRELFLLWQRTPNLDSLQEDLEPFLEEHLDFLLKKALPPTDARDREKALADAVLRLKEGALRSSLRAREELLLSAAEAGGVDAQLSQLEQQGVQLEGELKQVFKARKQRIGSKE
ncbi:MAG: toprim domain-containing protein, partial [Dehalococcoidia bacterium]